MFRTSRKLSALVAAATLVVLSHTAGASPARNVDLVIALDVSGSMSGLIGSAKQRLWDIVNDLGRAQPQPVLRVAIVSYGNPTYGKASGYVRIDQPFTTDLDAVNQTLFSFRTNGGSEYVARAVYTSIKQLNWSTQTDAMRIVFVAGNEAATQDPAMSIEAVIQLARDKDIVVNAIFCGHAQDANAAGWQRVARLNQGMYANIDQNAAAVANVATPMDEEIAKLNRALNETYVAYGREGEKRKVNQQAQDEQVARLSAPAAASRTITKASKLYDSRDWDLVDALKSGARLNEVAQEDLPATMQVMSEAERETFVQAQAEKREALKKQIGELDRERRDYIAEARKKADGEQGLDEAIQNGLRSVAKAKGFAFEKE